MLVGMGVFQSSDRPTMRRVESEPTYSTREQASVWAGAAKEKARAAAMAAKKVCRIMVMGIV